ncbi:MAG: ABC transporter ATP-binding protein [Kiloniellales bacterium]|nr:ABC transporter ATP-binding protein [Kiloniellales bacterium]
MNQDLLLDLQNLTKRFGRLTAVDDMSFAVTRGEVLGFLGPNGSGKTTTMRMVTGFLPPTSGSASVCGHEVTRDPIEVKRRVGYLPEGAPLYGDMTPAELLDFVARVRGFAGPDKARRMEKAIASLMLEEVAHRPIETLSKGFKRRVGIAQAILHDPEVLILDEPTDGLDPNQKHEVRGLLNELAGDKAIVISTHILEEIEALCTRTIVIARGRLVADETPEALLARSAYNGAVRIRIGAEQMADTVSVLTSAKLRFIDKSALNSRASLVVQFEDGDERDLEAVVANALADGNIGAAEIQRERGRLDDVFRSLTAGS